MNAMTDPRSSHDNKGHPLAKEAMARWGELKSGRGQHEQDWDDIARLIRPQRGGFGLTSHASRTLEKPLSSEPIMASSSFAAGLYAGLTNPANRWFGLETPDTDLNAWQPMAEWSDIVTARVAASFRPALSSFYPSTFQAYSDLSAFGNAAGYDEFDEKERKFLDVTVSLAEVCYDIDGWGRVWEWLRRFELTPRAAVALFKGRGELPVRLLELAEKGDTGKIAFWHHVKPNYDWSPRRIGPRGKPVLSVYACEIDEWLISEKGYDEMPAYAPRWDVDSGHIYGTGPGFIALPSARTVQRMEDATIRAAQYGAEPTMLAPTREDWPLNGAVRPGATIYGGMTINGQQVIRPLQTGGGIGLTIEEKRAKIEEIKNAFHYSIMSLQGRTGLTPEETLIIEEARMREWAPHSDRIMEEYAARKVERRFRQLWRMGQLPPPPQEAAGMPLQVRYTSAAQLAMKAREGVAIVQFVQQLGPLAQTNPRYLERIDPDALLEALHEASPSLPARILKSRDEADQASAQRAEQQQMANMMAMAQQGAGAAKDLASAGAAVAGGGDMGVA